MLIAKRKLYLMVALVAAIFGGCATGFKATHDHDPDQDFGGYQTFAWISAHPMKVSATAGAANPLLETRIMSAISDALVAKGYEKVDEAKNC